MYNTIRIGVDLSMYFTKESKNKKFRRHLEWSHINSKKCLPSSVRITEPESNRYRNILNTSHILSIWVCLSPWLSLPDSIRNKQSKVRDVHFNVDASKKYGSPCKLSVNKKLICGGNLAARYQPNDNQEKALFLCRGSHQSCPISEYGAQVNLSPKKLGLYGCMICTVY